MDAALVAGFGNEIRTEANSSSTRIGQDAMSGNWPGFLTCRLDVGRVPHGRFVDSPESNRFDGNLCKNCTLQSGFAISAKTTPCLETCARNLLSRLNPGSLPDRYSLVSGSCPDG